MDSVVYLRSGPVDLWPDHKVCRCCKQDKALTEYSIGKAAYGRRSRCKPCVTFQTTEYWKRHPQRQRANRLRKQYGLSLQDYDQLVFQHNGKCAVCASAFSDRMARRLCVDHDHKTGKVRGLLCFNCNTVLGKMQDSPDTLRRAAAYLEKYH